jgi:arylsulfatase A-like enzyme
LKSPVTHFFRRKLGGRAKKVYREVIGWLRSIWFSTARTMYRGGLIDNPLSSITGHGFHVYDSLVRVPLIISGHKPDNPGIFIDDQIRQIDMLPTILEMAGLHEAVPVDIDGRTVLPLVKGDTLEPIPAIIETCQNPSEPSDLYGVRTKDWKYAVHISDPSVPEELYDLSVDPKETTNIAEERPEVIKDLRAILDAHLKSEKREGVSLTDELSQDELTDLAKHLEKLGYIE